MDQSYGTRLLPHILDDRARAGYARPYAYIARSPNAADGSIEITYRCFANAVNRLAWWLDDKLAGIVGQGETFAYFGLQDLKYPILILAAAKTRRKILLPSLRNTIEAQQLLFQKSKCKAIVYDVPIRSILETMLQVTAANAGIQGVQVPSLDEAMEEPPVPHYSFDFTYEEVKDDVVTVMHSSGSSGNPKPVFHTHDWLARIDSGHLLSTDQKIIMRDDISGQRFLCLLPLFHAAGMSLALGTALFYEATVIMSHPSMPPTGEYIASLLSSLPSQERITTLIAPPSILGDISDISAGIDLLSKLEHVLYAGGPLPPVIGNKLAPKLKHLGSLLGMTEYGWYHLQSGPSSRWAQLNFVPEAGYRFELAMGGMYELIIPHDLEHAKFHGTPLIFPELPEYRTRDIYSEGDDGWWQYRGRVDDLIVLSIGEKINPVPQEHIINAHPSVNAALVIGEHQFLPSLLVELYKPPETDADQQAIREVLWPTVEEANKIAPRYAKIPKSLIVFVPPGKAFLRAGKGTVQRWLTVKQFKRELEDAYTAAQEGLLTEGLQLDDPHDRVGVQALVRQTYAKVLDMDMLEPDDDVFERGMDSLQVSMVVQQVRATLRQSNVSVDTDKVNPPFIYAHPTVSAVSDALSDLIDGLLANDLSKLNLEGSNLKIQELIDKYSKDLPFREHSRVPDFSSGVKVLLTGSTGSLGSYLLDVLLSSPSNKISRIFCLNRSKDGAQRQKQLNTMRGLPSTWNTSEGGQGRVQFLTADLSKPDFGLTPAQYQALQSEVNIILHCAWKVDFNLAVSSFERTHIAGIRHLLSLSSTTGSPVFFLSSISTALNLLRKEPTIKIPESILSSLSAPEPMGYAQSKYIAERMLDNAGNTNAGLIPHNVLRIGQIAGPVLPSYSKKGYWNRNEWFPSLIFSSKHLGLLPESLGVMNTMDFIPVDILARVIIELIFTNISRYTRTSNLPPDTVKEVLESNQGCQVYNLLNPHPVLYPSLLPTIQPILSSPKKESEPITATLTIASPATWISALSTSQSTHHGAIISENPGLKLLDFYESSLLAPHDGSISPSPPPSSLQPTSSQWETTKMTLDSPTARTELKAVDDEWTRIWFRQWSLI